LGEKGKGKGRPEGGDAGLRCEENEESGTGKK